MSVSNANSSELPRIAVVIPAAGASSRYLEAGALRHKLDEDLGGKPVLQRTIEVFTKFDSDQVTIAAIIVAGPHDDQAFAEFKDRYADRLTLLGARIIKGGKSHRWETVAAALAHVPDDCTYVAIHDAARPCVSFDILHHVFREAIAHEAAIPGIPLADTLKSTRIDEYLTSATDTDRAASILGMETKPKPARVVESTVSRQSLYAAQTPQVFEKQLLKRAYAQLATMSEADRGAITDDASLVERLGITVVVVDGDSRNIKLTHPADIDIARAIMGLRATEGRATHKKF